MTCNVYFWAFYMVLNIDQICIPDTEETKMKNKCNFYAILTFPLMPVPNQ